MLKTVYVMVTVFVMSLLSFQVQAKSDKSAETEVIDVEFVDLDGNVVMLSDFKGKWVVVNLWATWCPPCLKEIPELIMFHEANKDNNAIVLGLNYETNPVEDIKVFAEEQMINFPIVRLKDGADGRTTPFGLLRGLPTTYMISPSGSPVAATVGLVSMQDLEDFIKAYEEEHGK